MIPVDGRRSLVPAVALVALVAVGATSFTLLDRRDTGQKVASNPRRQELFLAFKPVAEELVEVLESRRAWQEGKSSKLDFALSLDDKRPAFEKARDEVLALRLAHFDDLSLDLYLGAARLYLETLRLFRLALDVPGPLGTELDRSAGRVRVLADRVYDQAKSSASPAAKRRPSSTNEEYRMVSEVPDWVEEGLAPGPPLADTAAPAAPAPARGGRERSAVLSLGRLVHEEAARVGQGAGMVADPARAARLATMASRLSLIGDRLWDPAAESRASGFDDAVLFQTGP